MTILSEKKIIYNIIDKNIDRYSELMKLSEENVDVMFFIFAHNVSVLLLIKGLDIISEEKYKKYSAMNSLSDSDAVFMCGGFLAAFLHTYKKDLELEIKILKTSKDEEEK